MSGLGSMDLIFLL